jgi:hypothetical protein
MYFARIFNRPVYAAHQRVFRSGGDIFDLFWHDPRGSKADLDSLPKDAFFRGVDVVFMRSSWTDPNALFVGFKGGDNAANHSNLDLGTFVLDALGERWAVSCIRCSRPVGRLCTGCPKRAARSGDARSRTGPDSGRNHGS